MTTIARRGIQIFRTTYCIADGTIGDSTIGSGKVDDAANRMAYSMPAMAFCSHCGSPTTGGRFCAACGSPLARDAVASVTDGLLRRHKKMSLMVAALCLVFAVTAALVVSRVMHTEPSAGAPRAVGISAPVAQPAQTPPVQASAPYASTSPPQPTPASTPSANNNAVHPSTNSIDPQEVQRTLNTRAQRADHGEMSAQQPGSASVSGSDRYPGSQPVEVKDVSLPDIGVPVGSEVYTTTDSVAAVIDYYRQRYPEAEVTEVNGQKIVAVNQPGAIKVIAVGTTGTETRIAIVQPAQ
jgi:ribosomal protein L32